jgi:hypothetical protein
MSAKSSLQIIPERLLRQIWKDQIFRSHHLLTTNRQNVRIVEPGVSNQDGGPDFLDARIIIDGITLIGDVELHCRISDWKRHSHEKDPKYNRVILHVVLHADKNQKEIFTKSKREVPTLILHPYLTEESFHYLESSFLNEKIDKHRPLKCMSLNSDVDAELIKRWFNKLSIERLEYKVRRFEERLKNLVHIREYAITEPATQYGEIQFEVKPEEMPDYDEQYSPLDFTDVHLWEQLLYEYVMEGLGYSKNQTPFLRLARNIELNFFRKIKDVNEKEDKLLTYEALLFGVAGLLPKVSTIKLKASKNYALRLKKIWRNHQNKYYREMMSEADWQFFRLRPDNFPTRRIAGAACIIDQILSGSYFKVVIRTIQNDTISNAEKFDELIFLLSCKSAGFWLNHYRFQEEATGNLNFLIGRDRAIELVVNVIIPLSLLYARIFKKVQIRKSALSLFESLKFSKSNAITKIVDEQLIKGRLKLDNTALYQGTIQLYKFYCEEEKCMECEIGKSICFQ